MNNDERNQCDSLDRLKIRGAIIALEIALPVLYKYAGCHSSETGHKSGSACCELIHFLKNVLPNLEGGRYGA